MECGHTPFYSAPEELAEHLETIAQGPDRRYPVNLIPKIPSDRRPPWPRRARPRPASATMSCRPETLMLGYGYDPALSEGAVKPPVFLTSTFVFGSAEEGRDFFDYASGRKQPPAGSRRRPRLFALQPSQQRDRRGPARGLRGRGVVRAVLPPAWRRSPRPSSPSPGRATSSCIPSRSTAAPKRCCRAPWRTSASAPSGFVDGVERARHSRRRAGRRAPRAGSR